MVIKRNGFVLIVYFCCQVILFIKLALKGGEGLVDLSSFGGILYIRIYDMYIIYDKYYQILRLWFFGYNEVKRFILRSVVVLFLCE